jgi:hypothetical protein
MHDSSLRTITTQLRVVAIMQLQALKCFIAALVPEGRYTDGRTFETNQRRASKNKLKKEEAPTTDIRFAAIDEAITRLNGVFFVLTEERAVHWHILHPQLYAMVHRWVRGGCSSTHTLRMFKTQGNKTKTAPPAASSASAT